ncbi:MAG: hypothetical protein IK000_08600 [Bacteroidaceae bacterium]|nr:hypothetical protein [Bacteroidaceae bacterium]
MKRTNFFSLFCGKLFKKVQFFDFFSLFPSQKGNFSSLFSPRVFRLPFPASRVEASDGVKVFRFVHGWDTFIYLKDEMEEKVPFPFFEEAVTRR